MDRLKQGNTLLTLNKWAGLLHLLNFVTGLVLMILYSGRSYKATLTTDFVQTLVIRGVYPLIWVDLPFSFITACFHLFLGFAPEATSKYRSYVFIRSFNPYRWLEYAITASLMTWVILQIAGVTDIATLVVVGVVGNVVLQCQGYFMDVLNPPNRPKINWLPTVAGWFLFAGQWTMIWLYFGYLSNRTWLEYTVVVGMFVQFCLFGMVQLLHYMRVQGFVSAYQVELWYMGLSYTSKFYLNWNLVINMLVS